jgi:hypothetical protein
MDKAQRHTRAGAARAPPPFLFTRSQEQVSPSTALLAAFPAPTLVAAALLATTLLATTLLATTLLATPLLPAALLAATLLAAALLASALLVAIRYKTLLCCEKPSPQGNRGAC